MSLDIRRLKLIIYYCYQIKMKTVKMHMNDVKELKENIDRKENDNLEINDNKSSLKSKTI